MKTIRLGVIMNGVTGRMGTNQHLIRSINAVRAQVGVALDAGTRINAGLDPRRPQLLRDPDLAAARMRAFLAVNGVDAQNTSPNANL